MGYRPPKEVFNLEFEDRPGLEVSVTGAALGSLLKIAALRVKLNEPDEKKKMEVFRFFEKRLKTWNIEHPDLDDEDDVCPLCGLVGGVPLPATVDGMLCLDLSFIMAIIFGWMAAVSRVSIPKEMNLDSGELAPESLMRQLGQLQSPMTSLTPNLS